MRFSKIVPQLVVFFILLIVPSFGQNSSSDMIRLQKELINGISIFPGRIIELINENPPKNQKIMNFTHSENTQISIILSSEPIVLPNQILGVSGFRTAKDQGFLEIRLLNYPMIQKEREQLIERDFIGVLIFKNKVFGISKEKKENVFGSWLFYVHFSNDFMYFLPLFFDASILEPVIINILNKG